jgi:hypothetical protein
VFSGCSIHFGDNTEQTNIEEKAFPIQASIYKHYEDGVDLKFRLLHAQSAKGTWTTRKCGKEEVQANKGAEIIYGVMDCEIPIGHENDKSYDTIYINFTGTVNGKKVVSDKVYVLDYDEVNKVPLERQNPDSQWVMIQTFIKTGYLYGVDVHIGSTKQQILDFFGDPKPSQNPDFLDYNEVQFFMHGDRVGEILVLNTKDSPIDLPNNDKDEIIRVFGNPNQTYVEDGVYYVKYNLGKSTATFAWSQKESKLISVDEIGK